MSTIILLPTVISNMIAAGEIIERASCVIKELVENSLDSGADKISIYITENGLEEIAITDNGHGISYKNMQMLLQKHATSKIKTLADLNAISSFGFRGEALASIASISDLEIISNTGNEDMANSNQEGRKNPEQEAGTNVLQEEPKELLTTSDNNSYMLSNINLTINIQKLYYAQRGTHIKVKNLFSRTPARLKFLKSKTTEFNAILKQVQHLAIANDIAFQFWSNKKLIFATSSAGNSKADNTTSSTACNEQLLSKIARIFGSSIIEHLLLVDHAEDSIKVSGYITQPHYTGSLREQWFFVNNRFVKDNMLRMSCKIAYHNSLASGKNLGLIVLFLQLNNNEFDVNVHPRKLEVRFMNETLVKKVVINAIKETLTKHDKVHLARSLKQVEQPFAYEPGPDLYFYDKQAADNLSSRSPDQYANIAYTSKRASNPGSNSGSNYPPTNYLAFEQPKGFGYDSQQKHMQAMASVLGAHNVSGSDASNNNASNNNELLDHTSVTQTTPLSPQYPSHQYPSYPTEQGQDNSYLSSSTLMPTLMCSKASYTPLILDTDYELVGQVFDSYIAIVIKDELLFIEQHGAHERILYHKLIREALPIQQLLQPEKIEVHSFNSEFDWLKFGITVRVETSNVAHEVLLNKSEAKAQEETREIFITGLYDKINLEQAREIIVEVQQTTYSQLFTKIISDVACKMAIKSNASLNRQEMHEIIRQILKLDYSMSCNHGRPIMVKMSRKELEKAVIS